MSEYKPDPFPGAQQSWPSTLLRVKGTAPTHVQVANPVYSWWMHWAADIARTVPCLLSTCENCKRCSPRRPLSYCGVLHYRFSGDGMKWARQTLELPFSTGIALHGLRGRTVGLRRIRPHGPVQIDFFAPKEKPPIVEPWDIVPGLSNMWRLPQGCQLALVHRDQWEMVAVAHA